MYLFVGWLGEYIGRMLYNDAKEEAQAGEVWLRLYKSLTEVSLIIVYTIVSLYLLPLAIIALLLRKWHILYAFTPLFADPYIAIVMFLHGFSQTRHSFKQIFFRYWPWYVLFTLLYIGKYINILPTLFS
ncbi:MAG: hypothetical protein ACMXYF_02080 [Candidatus Woesearchaeota archaeon]